MDSMIAHFWFVAILFIDLWFMKNSTYQTPQIDVDYFRVGIDV